MNPQPIPTGSALKLRALVRRWAATVRRRARRSLAATPWGAVLLIAVVSVGFAWCVAFIPELWTARQFETSILTTANEITAQAGMRQTILFMGGGVLAVVGIYYTHQRHISERATTKLQTASNVLQQDSNYTDRFTAAITHLGSDRLTIRLGGVYALERVWRDSQGDRETVQEVLAAFVRADSHRAVEELLRRGHDSFRTPLDVAAAMTVLSRRDADLVDPGTALDLGGAQLGSMQFRMSANLKGADLRRANMRDTNLISANLTSAHLANADLEGAQLKFASLWASVLVGTNLHSATLVAADLRGAELTGANLTGAHVEDAMFNGADLTGATLTDVVGWRAPQLEAAGTWSATTKWPEGHTPSRLTKS